MNKIVPKPDTAEIDNNFLLSHINDAVAIARQDSRQLDRLIVHKVNPAFETLFNTGESLIGKALSSFLYRSISTSTAEDVQKSLRTREPFSGDVSAIDFDGRELWIRLRLIPVQRHDPYESVVLVVITDLTSIQQAEAYLHRLSVRDATTGAFKRDAFFDLVMREVERSERTARSLAVVTFTLQSQECSSSQLTEGNDSLLVDLVTSIYRTVRLNDSVGRIGSLLLAVLMPETEDDGAARAIDRIQEAVQEDGLDKHIANEGVVLKPEMSVFNPKPDTSNDFLDELLNATEIQTSFGVSE